MSAENVELVRGLQPSPDTDLVALFRDDASAAALIEAVAPFFHDDVEIRAPGATPDRFVGLAGLRVAWLDWLEPWESYRTEVEDVIDVREDLVVVLVRDHGRRAEWSEEVRLLGASVWDLHDGKIARARFYADRADALRSVGLDR